VRCDCDQCTSAAIKLEGGWMPMQWS
jgi:hypothetical protein